MQTYLLTWERLAYKRNSFNLGFELLATAEKILSEGTPLHPKGSRRIQLMETVELYYSHACISTETGDFHKSLLYFQKGLDHHAQLVEQESVEIPYMKTSLVGGIANSLNGLGQDDKAEKEYVKCIGMLQPDEESPYRINICRCQWSSGQLEKASKGLEIVLARREDKFKPDDTQDYL